MVADPVFICPGPIADVRIRYGWWGKGVLQVRRHLFRVVLTYPRYPQEFKSCGLTDWVDAALHNPDEEALLNQVIKKGVKTLKQPSSTG